MRVFTAIVYLSLLSMALSANAAGDTIRVGLRVEPPFVIEKSDGSYRGLSVDLWTKIAGQQTVPFTFIEYSDHLGLLRALDFDEIDVTINPLHVSEIRLNMLDATQPFFVSSIGVAATQTEKSQLGVFLRNFFSLDFLRIIGMLVLVIFFFGTLLWLVERRQNQQFSPGIGGLFDGLWWSAVTMTTVGYGDKAPKSRMGRVIAMVWMFTAIIIISGFTATIASTLTVKSLTTEVRNLDDLKAVQAIGTVVRSSSEVFLQSNQIYPSRAYDNPQQALRGLAAKQVQVVIYDRSVLDYLISELQLNAKVMLLPVAFNQQYRSFFLPKNSPLIEWINPLLVRQINDASWPDMLKKYNLDKE